ncbi:hypothetical protein ACTXKQ_14455 [Corynebacterium variabile]|uniref:hypothetical protein n=1 Tax=Corynebacterium variabile TaxID=1727 RepID=UPI003F913348
MANEFNGWLDNQTRQMLEDLLDMSGGYVLDFSSRQAFGSFIQTTLGFDPLARYEGSMAAILRQIWDKEPAEGVAKLNLDLLERRSLNDPRDRKMPSEYDRTASDRVTTLMSKVLGPHLDSSDLDFLAKDFSTVDLASVTTELTVQQVIAARLDEIDRTLKAEAPLAVVFLVGSTLEGLLLDVSMQQPDAWTAFPFAPKEKGTVKNLRKWTLADLITVARNLGVLSEDVAQHSRQVRNFRNYIHPRQQLTEQFEPRMETARIAQQVLRGALRDLERVADPPAAP